MPAYVIADIEVHDPAAYEAYRQRVPATVAAHGGRYVARGGATRSLEGTWSPRRLVILEFPSLERFQAWWDSPEYQPLKAIRQGCSIGSLVVTEGL